ncbi:hypothetical protein GF354_04865 [Candidatus Peregrinibacteria bacterium]|nr:hypothetical protein [Candidatus Peregrinibacteria bacterium]
MKLKEKTIRLLKKIGLTDNEACFYYHAYKCKNQSVSDIQKKLKFSRATAYRIYDKLRDMKIVVPNHAGSAVQVASLNQIAQQLAKQGRKMDKLAFECRNVDSLLSFSTFAFNEEPFEIITDKNMIVEQNYKILHKKWDHLLAYGSSERLLDVVGDEHEKKFIKLRNRYGRSCSLYMTEFGDYAAYHMPNDVNELRDTKLEVDEKKQSYMMYIYGDEATIWHKDSNLGNRALVVSDPLLIQMYKSMFQASWA